MPASSVAIAGLVMALIQVFKPLLDATIAPKAAAPRTAFYQGLALLINAGIVAGQSAFTGGAMDPVSLFLTALAQGVVSVGSFHIVTGAKPQMVLVNNRPVPMSALRAPADAPVQPDMAPAYTMREG